MNTPSLSTSRLVLRPFAEQDAEPLHTMLGEEGVLRYFPDPNPPSLDRIQRFVQRQAVHWEEHGFGWWAVERQSAPGLIGWSGLTFLPETDEVEVAYLLGKAYWGQGYATEGARACLEFGFETQRLPAIIGLVHPENQASIHVIEKLGMSFVDKIHLWGIALLRWRITRDEAGTMHNPQV